MIEISSCIYLKNLESARSMGRPMDLVPTSDFPSLLRWMNWKKRVSVFMPPALPSHRIMVTTLTMTKSFVLAQKRIFGRQEMKI